jgi:hypothetical protein
MADAGVEVSRGPLRAIDDKLFVEIDWRRTAGAGSGLRFGVCGHPGESVPVGFDWLTGTHVRGGTSDTKAIRWASDTWCAGNLITTVGVDVLFCAPGGWYRPDPDLG